VLLKFYFLHFVIRQCFENGEYTIFADVWSAGCIFMEMLTQKNPWYIDKEQVTLEYIREAL
jgi:serine/threonine protein kinase